MDHVRVLAQEEEVLLDPGRLQSLYDQLGDVEAEDVVCRAMEELAIRLSMVERLYRQECRADMRKAARSLRCASRCR